MKNIHCSILSENNIFNFVNLPEVAVSAWRLHGHAVVCLWKKIRVSVCVEVICNKKLSSNYQHNSSLPPEKSQARLERNALVIHSRQVRLQLMCHCEVSDGRNLIWIALLISDFRGDKYKLYQPRLGR